MTIRQLATTFIPVLLLPLAACQKPQAATEFKITDSHNVEHSIALRLNKPWKLVSKTCEKSGQDLMKWAAVNGTSTTLELNETLNFTGSTLDAVDLISTSDSKTGKGQTTYSYGLKLDDTGVVWLSTTVKKVDFDDLDAKLGLLSSAKVGDNVEQKYEATSTTLKLTQANSSACADNTDSAISTYK